jgi:hypothetical protein
MPVTPWNLVYRPFRTEVWVAIMVTGVLVTLTYFLMFNLGHGDKFRHIGQDLLESVDLVIRSIFMQGKGMTLIMKFRR